MFGSCCCGVFSMATGRCSTFMWSLLALAYIGVLYLHNQKTHMDLTHCYEETTTRLLTAYTTELQSLTHDEYPSETSPRVVDIAEQSALHDAMIDFHGRFDEENTMVLGLSPATISVCFGVNVGAKLAGFSELAARYALKQLQCSSSSTNNTVEGDADLVRSLRRASTPCDVARLWVDGSIALFSELDRWFDVNGAWYRHRDMFITQELASAEEPLVSCSTVALTNKVMVFYDTALQVLSDDYRTPHAALLRKYLDQQSQRLLKLKVDYVAHMVDSMQGTGGENHAAMQTPVHAFLLSPDTTQNLPCENAAQCKGQIIKSAHYTDLFRHFLLEDATHPRS